MIELQLSEPEQRYFADLYLLCCKDDDFTAVPIIKACELFRTSKLPNDVLRQITDVCSFNNSSVLNRNQFFMALKLIAAAQAGLAVSPELVNSQLEVPLPRFTWPSEELPDLIELIDTTNTGKNSPSASSTASDSPTPTNSVQDKGWAAATAWQGIVCEEQRQLLGTEEESSDRHSSSEEAEPDSIYNMSEEQREYYTTQFHSLQPNPAGLLPGRTARLFFEMSRVPVKELRQIWQLADVTKDGALSLEEFNVAMHLIVLRRYQIPLPETLPVCLAPPLPPPTQDPPPSPLSGQTTSSSELKGSKPWTKFVESPTSSIASPGPKPVNFDFHKSAVEQDPKIFHPVPLRVTPEHNYQSTEPERESRHSGDGGTGGDNLSVGSANSGTSGKKVLLQSHSTDNADIRPIQRPTPRKPPPGPGAIPPPPHAPPEDFSGPTSLPVMAPKKEPPPPPPPRPYRTHARSSSLDLNHIGRSNSLNAPPAPPPRVSPNSGSPKRLVNQLSEGDCHLAGLAGGFHGNDDKNLSEADGGPRKHGAFHVYRKHPSPTSPVEVREVSQSVRRLEVQNSALALLCLQLNQELLAVQEERSVLQVKLEKLQAKYDA